jgi:mono/diheme cytochrome c family protein
MMRFAHLGIAAVIGVAIAVAHAQAPADPHKGRALAQRFCAECHAVGKDDDGSPNSEAPSFTAIAATPGMTAMALHVFFQTPHRSMPNLMLTNDQKNDIIAYIMSFKE